MIRAIVDGDEGYVDTREVDELAPIGIMGDSYPQFVKTGQIVQVRGTLTHLKKIDQGPSIQRQSEMFTMSAPLFSIMSAQ